MTGNKFILKRLKKCFIIDSRVDLPPKGLDNRNSNYEDVSARTCLSYLPQVRTCLQGELLLNKGGGAVDMKIHNETKAYYIFGLSISIVMTLFMVGNSIGLFIRNRELVNKETLKMARSYFANIKMIREWNTNYGGVWVKDKESPDNDRAYIKKDSALMAREVFGQDQDEDKSLFSFRTISLNSLNLENRPDDFEKEALQAFKKGEEERFQKIRKNSKIFFKYVAPLYLEESGDIGGISILFDISETQEKLKVNNRILLFISIVYLLFLLGTIYFFIFGLIGKLSKARQEIEGMAIIDSLTSIFNRRFLMLRFEEEFHRVKRYKAMLGCIMIDIDYFKSINDKYGHIFGDFVLKEICLSIKEKIRAYDIFGRYGGEEFVVLVPGADLERTKIVAEKIWKIVRGKPMVKSNLSVNVTVSLGATCAKEEDQDVDDVLKRADMALYRAKAAGRDRIVGVD